MCEAGLACKLLNVCRLALEDEDHPLHVPLQYMLERLAAQSLEPKDLRFIKERLNLYASNANNNLI